MFTLKKFLFCLELKLGGYIMAIMGMMFAVILVISTILFMSTEILSQVHKSFVPAGVIAGFFVFTGFSAVTLAAGYFYFSYQLLMGTRSVS